VKIRNIFNIFYFFIIKKGKMLHMPKKKFITFVERIF